ncbi:MAG: hypothetical protein AB1505_02935 [Candidatus Latescibacterota bacterium]
MRRHALLCAIRPLSLLAALLLVELPQGAEGTRPRLWRQHAYEDLCQGEAAGISVPSDGGLVLAPDLDTLATLDVQRIWSLAQGPDGRLYVGTGDGGQVYVVNPEGQARLLFDSPEVAIHALAFGPRGRLYAGTAPDGLVYAIDPESGEATTLCHTSSHYVWDLMADGEGGLLAATGDPGQVLAISPRGETRIHYDPSERHVMCLARLAGRLYAGTAQEARIYQVDGQGVARLLHSPPQAEVRNLAAGPDSALYAGAIPEAGATASESAPAAVYRIGTDGAVVTVWEEGKAGLLAMSGEGGTLPVLASGDPPALYRLEVSGGSTLLLALEDMQPSSLLPGRDGALYVGAAQSGRLLRLAAQRREGHFDSSVEDFGGHARWGRISWRAEQPPGTGVRLQTRSGNSDKPDDTWSPWSEPVSQSGRIVASPPARYLQYRVTLETQDVGSTPRVHEVGIVGQQTNLPPRITQLEVTPYRVRPRAGESAPEAAANNPAVGGDPRRPPHAKSLHLVRWQATDPNGDELAYHLYLRGAGQRQWKRVEETVTQTSVLWDTGLMPEGVTLLRLVVSDGPDNAPGEAHSDERISAPFAIDNAPPAVEVSARREGDGIHVHIRAHDAVSSVSRLQYSIDYSDQVTQVSPADGIFDSALEEAAFTLAGLAAGEHVIVAQAFDELDNIGVAQVVVEAK